MLHLEQAGFLSPNLQEKSILMSYGKQVQRILYIVYN